jgi:hypothetical protein
MIQDTGDTVPAPEFSRLLKIEPQMGAGEDGRAFSFEATAEECAALADRFSLISIEGLKVEGRIDVYARGREARLVARLFANVTQACVVSLAPVPAHLEEDFTRNFDRAAVSEVPAGPAVNFDSLADDPPDPLPERGIDVGEVAAEQLGLALEPYPRAAGALPVGESGEGSETRGKLAGEGGDPQESPFSVLRRLKDR